MCDRYASTRSRDELIETFDIPAERADPPLPADYNVAPTMGPFSENVIGHTVIGPPASAGQPH